MVTTYGAPELVRMEVWADETAPDQTALTDDGRAT
jgi:hypothetical protein